MQLDVFDSFRDRQITKSMLSDKGQIRVLRSKNMQDDGTIIDKEGYDKYIDDVSSFQVGKFLNKQPIIMVNFTYNTRATVLPDNMIPNGSIAVLLPKVEINKDELSFYSTPDFRKYYEIVKSKSRYTLNIDESSLYYIGKKL
jgi:DNA (cytosine-5)-methyltransferase 1